MEYQQSPNFFVRGPSAFTRLIGFATLSVLLIASDARFDYLSKVRANAVSLLYPFQWIANRPVILFNDISDLLTSHDHLQQEIKRLNLQALVQGESLQKLKTLELENEHLRALLDAQSISARPTKMAEIVHLGLDSYSHKIIVNAGRDKEIKAGQAVVDVAGVLGQVTKLYEHTSEVTLIIDQDLSIPVQVERNGLRAIAFGSGRENAINLPYLPTNVDIKVGDRLVTSGIDGVYPAGLGVAIVQRVQTSPSSPFAAISAEPIAAVHNFRQVLLLALDAERAVNDEVSKVIQEEGNAKTLNAKKTMRGAKKKTDAI